MNLSQKTKQIKQGKLTALENLQNFGKAIEQSNKKKFNIYLALNNKAIEQAREIDKRIKAKKQTGKLAGLCFSVKSNISVKGLETNCASKVLQEYISPYNATVINKLIAEDAILIGMTNMDEFAAGGSGETSAFGPTKNPKNPQLIPGGSSSGPAASVAAQTCDFALGSDTGGSIRNPASHCGITGLKPSYGAVSRYGLIDLSMSFDQIGPLTNSVEDAELIFNIIKGQDNFDTTTQDIRAFGSELLFSRSARRVGGRDHSDPKAKPKKQITIGLVNIKDFCNKEIAQLIKNKTEKIAHQNNWKIKSINLPLDIAIETYYLIIYVEFFSATRKFDGRRFGKKIEDTAGPEVIRRILGGSEISKAEFHGKYYRDALKAKNYVKQQFDNIFKQVDFLILPTVPKLPHKIGESISTKDMYAYDVLTVPANLAQIPAISIPAGEINKIPVGLQIMAPRFYDNLLLEFAKKFE